MDLTLIVVFVAFVVVIVYMLTKSQANENKEILVRREPELAKLKADYDTALQSGNKADALQKGRAYYSFLRGGTLTIYDEQALANDLNTMN